MLYKILPIISLFAKTIKYRYLRDLERDTVAEKGVLKEWHNKFDNRTSTEVVSSICGKIKSIKQKITIHTLLSQLQH